MKHGIVTRTLIAAALLTSTVVGAQELKPTNHPRLPAQAQDYWLAPELPQLRLPHAAERSHSFRKA